MSDLVRDVEGKTAQLRLSKTQRLLIETAHGLIEIKVDMDRSRTNSVQLSVTLPEDLRFRKGPVEQIELHTKFVDMHDGKTIPNFRLLAVHYETSGSFFLREPDSLVVGM